MMSDDERQIRVIIDYISEYLPEPQSTWPKKEFERVAYCRWAANEILKSLYNNPNWTAIRVVEEFKCQMGNYIMKSKSTHFPEASIHCEYAYEVACDIEEILMAMFPY